MTENHRCPRGIFSRVTEALSTVVVGGGLGVVLCLALTEHPAPALIIAVAALGAVLANAVRQAVGGRSS